MAADPPAGAGKVSDAVDPGPWAGGVPVVADGAGVVREEGPGPGAPSLSAPPDGGPERAPGRSGCTSGRAASGAGVVTAGTGIGAFPVAGPTGAGASATTPGP